MYEYAVSYGGNTLRLTGQERKWQIRSVSGLNPPSSRINESEVVGVPGVKKIGSKVNKRNIVLTIHINHPCEQNRDELLQFLSTDYEVDLNIITGRKNLHIKGTVETNEYDIYSQAQTMQVSILCDYPYFRSSAERKTNYVESVGGFSFPLSFTEEDRFTFDELTALNRFILYNYGQIQTGIKINLELYEDATEIKVFNVDDPNQYIGVKGTFYAGDIIQFDTNALASDKVVLIRNGKKESILRHLMKGVTWLKIDKILVLEVEGAVYTSITNHDEIAGV